MEALMDRTLKLPVGIDNFEKIRKSGFYYIAVKAKVPIILVKFDFGNKVVDYSEPFYPTGVYADDLPFIINHFKGTKGKNPELACQWEDEFKQENK